MGWGGRLAGLFRVLSESFSESFFESRPQDAKRGGDTELGQPQRRLRLVQKSCRNACSLCRKAVETLAVCVVSRRAGDMGGDPTFGVLRLGDCQAISLEGTGGGGCGGGANTRRLVSCEMLRNWRYSITPRTCAWNRSSTPATCEPRTGARSRLCATYSESARGRGGARRIANRREVTAVRDV